jgi:acid phosphatase
MIRRFLLAAALVAVGSCAARPAPSISAPAAGPKNPVHENLNAVLWMQTALEYEASALGAYRLASLQLVTALQDKSWTAALEQPGDAAGLPPAVILDVDETVLDNSYYQARQVRDNTAFAAETWDRWCQEARATAIPGAVEFTQDAAKRGVTVFYITNRTAKVEDATRRNLAALGFPLRTDVDTVLTRRERPEWEASPKGPRRAHVAASHRVLLLIGDDLGDFVVDASGTPAQRAERTSPQRDWWGRRWIMLPNPTYGSWERALVGTAKDAIAAKRAALKYEPTAIPNR